MSHCFSRIIDTSFSPSPLLSPPCPSDSSACASRSCDCSCWVERRWRVRMLTSSHHMPLKIKLQTYHLNLKRILAHLRCYNFFEVSVLYQWSTLKSMKENIHNCECRDTRINHCLAYVYVQQIGMCICYIHTCVHVSEARNLLYFSTYLYGC